MIKYIRIIMIVSSFAIFGLGAIILRYFVMIFPEHFIKDKDKKQKKCSEILKKSWFVFIKFLEIFRIIKLNKSGIEKIKEIKNSIIVSTHPSYIDVLLLIAIIPNTTCFVAEKLARNPFFKGMVDLLFVLDGKDMAEWEKSAVDKLEKGYNVLIFPMGERHTKNEQPKIRKGASFLAQKSKKNIVMLNIETSDEFLMKNRPIYKIGKEQVIYNITYLGEIDTEAMLLKYPDEVTFKKEVTDSIAKTLYQ